MTIAAVWREKTIPFPFGALPGPLQSLGFQDGEAAVSLDMTERQGKGLWGALAAFRRTLAPADQARRSEPVGRVVATTRLVLV